MPDANDIIAEILRDDEYVLGTFGDTGPQGEKGDAATITIGSVVTGTPQTPASVTNSGTQYDAVLNFVIPKGDTGSVDSTTDPLQINTVRCATIKAYTTGENVCTFAQDLTTFGNTTCPTKIIGSNLKASEDGNTFYDIITSKTAYTPNLLSFIWSDHLINNQAWLRADTFSWQSGETYLSVYQHLLNDIGYVRYMIPNDDIQEKFYRSPSDDTTMFAWTNQYSTLYTENEFPENGDNFYYHDQVFGTVLSTGAEAGSGAVTPTTETIGSYTITYYLADDGHKIVLADQETNVSNIYTATGVAWYYILDTVNTRFKLPRTKYNFVGLRDTAGKYVEESLPNITGGFNVGYGLEGGANSALGLAFYNSNEVCNRHEGSGSNNSKAIGFDASLSSSVYQNSAPVQQRATQMYLYFYVGQFSQNATEQTAGLNAELFNDKVDLDAANLNDNGKSLVAGLSLPSAVNDTLVLGTSGDEYTASANGYFVLYISAVSLAGYIKMVNLSSSFVCETRTTITSTAVWAFCPARKGEKVKVYYDVVGTADFKFIYAEGSKQEA